MYCTVIIGLVLAFDKAVEKMVCVGQTADLVEPGPGVRVRVLRRCRPLPVHEQPCSSPGSVEWPPGERPLRRRSP